MGPLLNVLEVLEPGVITIRNGPSLYVNGYFDQGLTLKFLRGVGALAGRASIEPTGTLPKEKPAGQELTAAISAPFRQ